MREVRDGAAGNGRAVGTVGMGVATPCISIGAGPEHEPALLREQYPHERQRSRQWTE